MINGKKTHPKTVGHHCEQSLDAVRKTLDPNATEVYSQGKRRYLMPMDKAMRKQIAPLAQPYPKNDDWVKIDRTKFKEAKDGTDNETE